MKYLLFFSILFLPVILQAESKSIQVYSISQSYRDIKTGETLGEITQQLMPQNRLLQQQLMAEIVEMNPQVFIDNDLNRMKANQRLWLPNPTAHLRNALNSDKYTIQQFSRGYIQRLK